MRKALLVALITLSPLLAEVTVTIFPTTTIATWTVYTESVVNGTTASLALVREASCMPIGMRGELVYNGGTVTINMGNVEVHGTVASPIAEYVTTINVNPEDVLYLTNAVPLVWCTNIELTTYSLIPVTMTVTGNVVTSVPIYYTTTESYLVPSITMVSEGPDLIVPTITLSPVTVTKIVTEYTTVTLTSNQVLTTTGLLSLSKTQYPYGMLQWKPTQVQVSVPTTVTFYNDVANVKVNLALKTETVTYNPMTTSESSSSTTAAKVPGVALLAPIALAAALGKRKRK